MKLIIQIPCYNEAETLPVTLSHLPKHIDGIDIIEVLVIDDGSVDETARVAREHGVQHIVQHTTNKGLAAAFRTGLDTALGRGADIIVNTDADNQYPGESIPALVAPLLRQDADIVIGDRQTDTIPHFSSWKKRLQKAGSWVVRVVSGTEVPDAPSGFRAMTREAALRTTILTDYSYTLETIIQAGKKNLFITSIPIKTNPDLRESRLLKSNFDYVLRSARTILKLFLLYEPLRSFLYLSLPFFLVGSGLWVRYLILLIAGNTARGSNIQSVVVGSVAIITGVVLVAIGLLGDVLASNRQLNEENLYLLRTLHYKRDGADEPGRQHIR